ncbi:hypothetical protein F53441_9662 [Fusarium austroafricanum]|uniref:Uncharacterized protein n=1 Tax=Fusarium austroafricanum TaxID=2364996 RepID=A0A8H4NQ04_9HYPO|nr:hypothetical protein F53441_9662 [Fusarium austroafricanum]
MAHPVYKVKSTLSLPDPHMPPGRLHHAIFVETNENGSGIIYEVTGDVTSIGGMTYESTNAPSPKESENFHSMDLLGYRNLDIPLEKWNSILSSLPAPPQQKVANTKKQGQVEPFKEKISDSEYIFYEPGDEKRPLWKCTEWIEQYAIPALWEHNLIQRDGSSQA